jgi:hypothetical protein
VDNDIVREIIEITPCKPCRFNISKIAFRFWNAVNVQIPIEPLRFCSLSSQPSIQVEFHTFPDELIENEIHHFHVIVRNVGDACMGELMVLHDSIGVIEFEHTHQVENFAVVTIIAQRDHGIRPKEEIEFAGRLHGPNCSLDIHCMWCYRAQRPFIWRTFCQTVSLKTCVSHTIDAINIVDSREAIVVRMNTRERNVNIERAVVDGIEYVPLQQQWLSIVPPYAHYSFVLVRSASSDSRLNALFCKTGSSMFEHKIMKVKQNEFGFRIEAPTHVVIEQGGVAYIGIILELKNLTAEKKTQIRVRVREVANANWSGLTQRVVNNLEPNEARCLRFGLILMIHGMFDIAKFLVLEGDKETICPLTHFVVVK